MLKFAHILRITSFNPLTPFLRVQLKLYKYTLQYYFVIGNRKSKFLQGFVGSGLKFDNEGDPDGENYTDI